MMGYSMFIKNNNKSPRKAEGGRPGRPKKARGGMRKRKSAPPLYERPMICPPDRSGMSLRVRIAGFICRAALIFFSVYALVFFVVDALFLESQGITVSAGFIAVVAVVSVATFSLMRTSRIGLAVGSLLLLGGAGVLIYSAISVPEFFPRVLITAKDVVLRRLFNRGYLGMSVYMSNPAYGPEYTAELYFKYAVVLFAVLLSLCFVLSMIKRVRVIFPAAFSALMLVGVFTVNISRSNWGIALMIASFTGLLVMAGYDSIFTLKPDDDKYDTETLLFDYADRPPLPEEDAEELAAKAGRRAAKREYRALKKRRRRERIEINVDEELSAYFGTSSKPKRVKPAKGKGKPTPEERRAAAAARRERKAKINARRNYDAAVRDSRAAQGGFAAFGAFALAMLMLLLPAMTVSGNFSTISVIDERMGHYREIVEALLMGDDPKLDELSYMYDKNNFTPRSTDAVVRHYTGAKVFTVGTMSATPVYLRGWIGADYRDGAWLAASDRQLEAYRALYGTDKDPSEAMFNYFYSFMNPALIRERDYSINTSNNARYGFVVMQVNLSRIETGDSMVYMPSFLRSDAPTKASRSNVNKGSKPGKDDTYGLYEYGTNTPSGISFVNYFDGIYTGRKFMGELEYSAVSNVTTMKISDWYENVAAYISDYNKGYLDALELIRRYADRLGGDNDSRKSSALESIKKVIFAGTPEGLISNETDLVAGTTEVHVRYDRGTVLYTYDTASGELLDRTITERREESYEDPVSGEILTRILPFTVPEPSLELRYYCGLLTEAEKNALVMAYFEQYNYKSYVYENYLECSEGDIIRNVLKDIKESAVDVTTEYPEDENEDPIVTSTPKDFSRAADKNSADAETYEQRHRLVMEIVNYLKANYTYTLEPSVPADPDLDGVENFLSVTREGYCVQFASSLALLLREAGIPARYVEGYVASGFDQNYYSSVVGRYAAVVRDYNAHAWVEVWYDGVGWIQYEATPAYYSDMYVRYGGDGDGGGGAINPLPPVEEIPEERETLDMLLSTIDLAGIRIALMREDIAMLFGGSEISATLVGLSGEVSSYRALWQEYNDEYEANYLEQGFDRNAFLGKLNALAEEFGGGVSESLNSLDTRIESLVRSNRMIWVALALSLLALAVAALLTAVAVGAKRAEDRRRSCVARIVSGNFGEEERPSLVRLMIDATSALLAAYRSSPKPGEFREEYADRLGAEYIDVFIRDPGANISTPDSYSEEAGSVDFRSIFNSIAAEEFGYGMTRDELTALAVFYKGLRAAAPRRLSLIRRAACHFIGRII